MNIEILLKKLTPEQLKSIVGQLNLFEEIEGVETYQYVISTVAEDILCENLPLNNNKVPDILKEAFEQQKYALCRKILTSKPTAISSLRDFSKMRTYNLMRANSSKTYKNLEFISEGVTNALHSRVSWCVDFGDIDSLKSLESEKNFTQVLDAVLDSTNPADIFEQNNNMFKYLADTKWAIGARKKVSDNFERLLHRKEEGSYLVLGVLDFYNIKTLGSNSLNSYLDYGRPKLKRYYHFTKNLLVDGISISETEMQHIQDSIDMKVIAPDALVDAKKVASILTKLKVSPLLVEKYLLDQTIISNKRSCGFKI